MYIGDHVEYYNPIMVYGTEQARETTVVVSIDTYKKSIMLSNNFLFEEEGRIRRIIGYNEIECKRKHQNGLNRVVGDFVSNNVQPDIDSYKVLGAVDNIDAILEKDSTKLKRSLQELGSPYADFLWKIGRSRFRVVT